MQDVYSHFNERIPLDSSSFSVANPNRYRDGIDRVYSFKYLNIAPEYFSVLATHNEMDNEEINPIITRYKFEFEVHFADTFYGAEKQIECIFKAGEHELRETLSKLNSTINDQRNHGLVFQPVIFDWVTPSMIQSDDPNYIKNYMKKNKEEFYLTELGIDDETENTTFKEDTHANVLFDHSEHMDFVNTYLYPDDIFYFRRSRVRMIIGPNTKVSFSNEKILKHLGFTPKNYGIKRGQHNRFHIVNDSPDSRMHVVAENYPKGNTFELIGESKVYVTFLKSQIKFERYFYSTKYKELRPQIIGNDLQALFRSVAQETYVPFVAKFDPAYQYIAFTFPDNPQMFTQIHLSPEFMKAIKSDTPLSVNNKNTKRFEKPDLDIDKEFKMCKILTQDTCDVIITLANVPSILHRGQTEQIVAALLPKDDILKNVKNVQPQFILPQNNEDLIFKIYRHAEAGRDKLIPLGWPLDCYVYGMLCGTPINRTMK